MSSDRQFNFERRSRERVNFERHSREPVNYERRSRERADCERPQMNLGRRSRERADCERPQVNYERRSRERADCERPRVNLGRRSREQADCERPQVNLGRRSRERPTPWSHHRDGYPRGNAGPEKSALLNQPAAGSGNRYYNQGEFRQYPENRRFPRFQRSGQPQKRGDQSTNQQPANKRARNFFSSARNRSNRRNAFFRQQLAGRKNFPQRQFGSTVTTSNDAMERSQTCFRRPQGRRRPGRFGKPSQFFKPSSDTPPLNSKVFPTTRVLAIPKRLTEEELKEAASKWAEERKREAAGTVPENPESAAASMPPPLMPDQLEEEAKAATSTNFLNVSQQVSRCTAILLKRKEIEYDYQRDCETFVKVVKKLIEKVPSLAPRLPFAVRQNLWEISEHYVQVLRQFIADYDKSHGFTGPF